MVICLERGADLHMAQLMPLPLTVSCFTKIQTGFTFLVPAHLGSPGKRAVKRVCVCVCVIYCMCQHTVVLYAYAVFYLLQLLFVYICCGNAVKVILLCATTKMSQVCTEKHVSDVSVRYSSNSLRKDVIRFPTEFQDERILKYKICDRVTV